MLDRGTLFTIAGSERWVITEVYEDSFEAKFVPTGKILADAKTAIFSNNLKIDITGSMGLK